MFSVDNMLSHELTFCQLFTNKVTKEYGIIYCNPLNPFSHDSNHAHILNIDNNPEMAIQRIVQFYRNYGLVPRIYCSSIDGELTHFRATLESLGFTLTVSNEEFMVFPHPFSSNLDTTLSVRRITGIPDDIIDLIHTGDAGDWTINVLKNAINHENFHLLGLFEHDRCVAIASIQVMDGYSRIDNVVTHLAFRGQHFGTRLIRYLVKYHAALSGNYLYLFADNPIAIRLYKNVGFQTMMINKPYWNAHIPV
jgi:ribosomal protein S18 acetylase RimI-like enzyme